MDSNKPTTISFQQFSLDKDKQILSYADQVVSLNWKTLSVLQLLIENPGELITRERMIEEVWDGQYVSGDKGLSTAIWHLRQHFQGAVYIQTVPKKGYKLVVSETIEEGTSVKPESNKSNKPYYLLFVAILVIATLGVIVVVSQSNRTADSESEVQKVPLLFLKSTEGGVEDAEVDAFFDSLENHLVQNKGYMLADSAIKKTIIESGSIQQEALNQGIHHVLKVYVIIEETGMCRLKSDYNDLMKGAYYTNTWTVGCHELIQKQAEIKSVLPQNNWQ